MTAHALVRGEASGHARRAAAAPQHRIPLTLRAPPADTGLPVNRKTHADALPPAVPRVRQHDGPAAADLVHIDLCRAPLWRHRDRVAPGRTGLAAGSIAPLHVPGLRRARPPPGPCAGRPWHDDGGTRRHAGVERLPPSRAVLRGVRRRTGAPHGQSAPARRPGRVYRQSRRRPASFFRYHVFAAGRSRGCAMSHGQGLRADE